MTQFQGVAPVFRREFTSYFSSPLGYVFIVIFLLASGYLTVSRDFGRFLEIRQANLDAFFASVPWIFVVLVPAVAMRLWAEERKSGTIELLLTLPIGLEGAYVGKFLAGWSFLGVSLSGLTTGSSTHQAAPDSARPDSHIRGMRRNPSRTNMGAWLSAATALAPILGALIWAVSETSILGFA